MTDLPAPLVPAYVDLTDFKFMPLHVQRLRDSDLVAMSHPVEFAAAVLLWCASWHQVPCGSLTNDDRVLSKYAGYGNVVKEWLKIKRGALRGFVLCSDGRLYHPVVAEQAMEGWKAKIEQRWKTECARIKKYNQRHKTNHPSPSLEDYLSSTASIDVPRDNDDVSPGTTPPRPADVPKETPSKGQGQGQVEEIIVDGDEPILDGPAGVIQVFDRISRKIFSAEKSRAWPASTDHVYAQRFLDAGADIELLEGVFSSLLLRFKAEGQSAPDQLKVFEKWVSAALKAKNSPLAEAKYVNGTRTKPAKPSLDDQLAELDRLRAGSTGPLESFGDIAGGIIIDQPSASH